MIKQLIRKLIRKYTSTRSPNVIVVEKDCSSMVSTPSTTFMFLSSMTGPVNSVKFYGPSISRPRWYQPWRWHLIKEYRRQCKSAEDHFVNDFGSGGACD